MRTEWVTDSRSTPPYLEPKGARKIPRHWKQKWRRPKSDSGLLVYARCLQLIHLFSEEVEEETQVRMMVIQEQESRQWEELGDLFEAELDYFSRCKEILEELRMSWPTR